MLPTSVHRDPSITDTYTCCQPAYTGSLQSLTRTHAANQHTQGSFNHSHIHLLPTSVHRDHSITDMYIRCQPAYTGIIQSLTCTYAANQCLYRDPSITDTGTRCQQQLELNCVHHKCCSLQMCPFYVLNYLNLEVK